MKRILSIVLVIAMCLSMLLLTGCGRGKIADADLSGGYDGSAVTITFYHTMSATNLQPVLNDAIARFN